MKACRSALTVAVVPIYFSSGMDYRWARPEATTARFGHGSTAAGQGTKGRDKRWLRGPRLLQPGKRPGWRGGGLLSCAAVSSTNLLVSEAGRRKFYLSSQASLPESKRSALAVSLFLFDPPTHPGNRCSREQGGVAVAAGMQWSGERGLAGDTGRSQCPRAGSRRPYPLLIYQSISVVAWTTGGHGQELLLP